MADNEWTQERLAELQRERRWKELHAAAPGGAQATIAARSLAADALQPVVASWRAKVAALEAELERLTRERDDLREGMRVATVEGRSLVAERDALRNEITESRAEAQ